ncbi:MAG: 30S ribosomal protein S12 methylthiotransferase RimO [Acidobacteriota bacterium]
MEKTVTTASFISLGCFKNIVDTEVLGGMLNEKNIKLVSPYEETDWLIINTCGFIRDAKEESIDEILNAFERKDAGEIKYVAVFGCLVQRYHNEIKDTFKNADILWGVNDMEELAQLILEKGKKEYEDKELFLYDHQYKRIITTTPNSTFLKISEGCNMKCSFCSIPQIRGKFRSRSLDSIIKEAENYRNMGFKELNLISQNSTYFGRDNGGRSQLPILIKEISKVGFDWVRVLYLMPEDVNDEVIDSFKHPSILPYFDLPFQHVSKKILTKMKRGSGIYNSIDLITKIRKEIKDAVIRSSFITGFPGETEDDFDELKEFVSEMEIERLGVFGYSDEENTAAFSLKNKISPEVIEERKEIILDISDKNIKKYNNKILETTQIFLPLGPWDNNTTIGRIKSQAPETDGLSTINTLFEGEYLPYKVKVTGSENELIYGEKL